MDLVGENDKGERRLMRDISARYRPALVLIVWKGFIRCSGLILDHSCFGWVLRVTDCDLCRGCRCDNHILHGNCVGSSRLLLSVDLILLYRKICLTRMMYSVCACRNVA